jgi:hypothetical protein
VFLHAQPDRLLCFDAGSSLIEELTRVTGHTQLVFRQADVLQVEIEETDLLFIDTRHVYEQRKKELWRHAGKVRKYLVLHRTSTHGHEGEIDGLGGTWPAVTEFLAEGTFQLQERSFDNNGLAVLERVREEAEPQT